MAKIRDVENKHGVLETEFICEYCGNIFSVCPRVPDDKLGNWLGCTVPGCKSYDCRRDVDAMLFFGIIGIAPKQDE